MSEPASSEFVDPANLDAILETALIGNPKPRGRRLLGIEVERLILHEETLESAPLEFCQQLLGDLATDIDGWLTLSLIIRGYSQQLDIINSSFQTRQCFKFSSIDLHVQKVNRLYICSIQYVVKSVRLDCHLVYVLSVVKLD